MSISSCEKPALVAASFMCAAIAWASAITGVSTEEEPATVIGDGYMGGGAIYGSKSNHHLYGSSLSAAVREDLKKAGIKGTSVKIKTYSGGQSLTSLQGRGALGNI